MRILTQGVIWAFRPEVRQKVSKGVLGPRWPQKSEKRGKKRVKTKQKNVWALLASLPFLRVGNGSVLPPRRYLSKTGGGREELRSCSCELLLPSKWSRPPTPHFLVKAVSFCNWLHGIAGLWGSVSPKFAPFLVWAVRVWPQKVKIDKKNLNFRPREAREFLGRWTKIQTL